MRGQQGGQGLQVVACPRAAHAAGCSAGGAPQPSSCSPNAPLQPPFSSLPAATPMVRAGCRRSPNAAGLCQPGLLVRRPACMHAMPPLPPLPPPPLPAGFPNTKTGSLFTAIIHIFWHVLPALHELHALSSAGAGCSAPVWRTVLDRMPPGRIWRSDAVLPRCRCPVVQCRSGCWGAGAPPRGGVVRCAEALRLPARPASRVFSFCPRFLAQLRRAAAAAACPAGWVAGPMCIIIFYVIQLIASR
jgi:hypothetical protein